MRRKLNLYPYRLQTLQKLGEPQFEKRKCFADWMLNNESLIDDILWTDEANFSINGSINTHNCVIYSKSKPEKILSIPLHSAKITVWMGFSAKLKLTPYFFDSTVDGDKYLEMLKNHLRPQLTARKKLSKTIVMQDGAPPHVKKEVKQFLVENFTENRIISRHFPIEWPPYSPDVNPLEFFFHGDYCVTKCTAKKIQNRLRN